MQCAPFLYPMWNSRLAFSWVMSRISWGSMPRSSPILSATRGDEGGVRSAPPGGGLGPCRGSLSPTAAGPGGRLCHLHRVPGVFKGDHAPQADVHPQAQDLFGGLPAAREAVEHPLGPVLPQKGQGVGVGPPGRGPPLAGRACLPAPAAGRTPLLPLLGAGVQPVVIETNLATATILAFSATLLLGKPVFPAGLLPPPGGCPPPPRSSRTAG